MSAVPTDLYVDAPGWSDTVTVDEERNHTSDDGRTTTTGSATFTYQRVFLAALVANPRLPCQGLPAVGNGQFLAVRYAVGQAPGWLVVFGPQDPQTGAFTQTTQPSDPHGTPTVERLDATCSLAAVCAPTAPGLYAVTGAQLAGAFVDGGGGGLLSLNAGVTAGEGVHGAAYTVALLSAAVPADPARQQPGVPAVYRVSLPTDLGFFGAFSMVVNGSVSVPEDATALLDGAAGLIQDAILAHTSSPDVRIEALSPWTYDVQMPGVDDTLAAGTVSYARLAQAESTLTFPGGATQTIEDPFPMAGQSFTNGPDDEGLRVQVHF